MKRQKRETSKRLRNKVRIISSSDEVSDQDKINESIRSK